MALDSKVEKLASFSSKWNPAKEAKVRQLAELVQSHPATEIRSKDESYHRAAVILENWYCDACYAGLAMFKERRYLHDQVFTALRRAYQVERAMASVDQGMRVPIRKRDKEYYTKLISNLKVLDRPEWITKYQKQAEGKGIRLEVHKIEKADVEYNPFTRGKRINFSRDHMEVAAESVQSRL
ncbi:hypothetical protein KY361_06485 [Candidatus Woesearchaeota archaeon]|nr:hypothetical protein [Candidatus Woesearchaeota archaeon]